MKCVPFCTLTPAAERVHDKQELFKNGGLWVFPHKINEKYVCVCFSSL